MCAHMHRRRGRLVRTRQAPHRRSRSCLRRDRAEIRPRRGRDHAEIRPRGRRDGVALARRGGGGRGGGHHPEVGWAVRGSAGAAAATRRVVGRRRRRRSASGSTSSSSTASGSTSTSSTASSSTSTSSTSSGSSSTRGGGGGPSDGQRETLVPAQRFPLAPGEHLAPLVVGDVVDESSCPELRVGRHDRSGSCGEDGDGWLGLGDRADDHLVKKLPGHRHDALSSPPLLKVGRQVGR